jgi:glutathione S-transferase
MADLKLYGFAQSTYTRTACLACEEKGVAYEIVPTRPGSPENLAVHPFGKIPAMSHGDFKCYETVAICRYVDEAFDGPALQPADAKGRALMTQWISAANRYYDTDIIRHVVLERMAPRLFEREPDEAKIKEAMPRIEREIEVLDGWLGDHAFLAGDGVSIADFFMLPILFYFYNTPEGKPLCDDAAGVMRWWGAMSSRPSFEATSPAMPEAAE